MPHNLIPRLYHFQPPERFVRIQEAGNASSLEQPQGDAVLQRLREAWVAGRFALGLESRLRPVELRVVRGEFPDIEIRIKDHVHPFEVTTVLSPGRKADREAREEEGGSGGGRAEPPRSGTEDGPKWVAERIEAKRNKHYSPMPHLLLYADFESNGLDPHRLRRECHRYAGEFPSIWVLDSAGSYFLQLFDSETFGRAQPNWVEIDRPVFNEPASAVRLGKGR